MKLTPKDIAKEFGISDKRVRRVMRSLTDERAGHGGTWDLDSDSDFVTELRFRLAIGGRSVKVSPTLKAQVVRTVTETLAEIPETDES
jgi:tRNA U55 pseudouridine synthase TruB